LNSVLWVLLPLMLWVPGNPHNNYFVVIIVVANTLFVFQLAIHRTIFLIMLAPGLVALFATLLLDGSSYLIPYMVMTPVFLIWAGGLGLQLNEQISQAVKTGLNNRALADEVGEARDEALRQKAVADQANAAKSSFLATMSHELRTPLNAIIGFSQIIRLQMLGREAIDKYASYAGDIEDSGKHLLGLINQILDLAKIEAGTMAFSPSDFDVAAIVDECAHSMRIRAEDKGMTLSVARQHQRIMVRADEMAVRQIVLNLLANAVKFTAKGSITVGLDVQGDAVEIAVADTGCGIDNAHVARIFQPFEQVDNSLSREHGGTGLGLPIVAKLAQAHGGACSVESTLGVGSRFAVKLPIVTDALLSAA
jgi:signal transduction histidine kinase